MKLCTERLAGGLISAWLQSASLLFVLTWRQIFLRVDACVCTPLLSEQRRGDAEVSRRTDGYGALARPPLTKAGIMSKVFDGGLIVPLKLWIAFIWRALPGDDCLIWHTGNVWTAAKLDLLAAELHIFELESWKVLMHINLHGKCVNWKWSAVLKIAENWRNIEQISKGYKANCC